MTLEGAVGKTAIMLLVTACAAGYMWQQFAFQLAAAKSTAAIVALKGGLAQTSMVIVFYLCG
jgi:uncharacterized YccA/Bax inhibitor family protein